ncbi:unnamed protein product [Caenorhabditis angaria]|uniref:Neurotransmitter-gated ion-channel ligand-binding domain-containing protein n=1 Tax=Caenorhabditis angaria TaxID=860376 RepID=A0A9P1IRY8_9PELO|nr:unnamed protein product [Caenorhabditis angaria]
MDPDYNHTYDGWTFWIVVYQIKVIDLDEPQELFTTSITFLLEWRDFRIAWNNNDYDGIQSIFVRQDMMWSPPLAIFSASDVKDHRDLDFRILEVEYFGRIVEYVTMRLTTNCGLNMACLALITKLYNLSIHLPDIDEEMLCDMCDSAWTIVNVSIGSLQFKPYRTLDSRLGVVRVVLKRNPIFYMYMIILPTFTINMIAIGGVFLKKSTQIEKLTIGFTHIMTMTFILGLVSEKIPKTSEIPLLGKYIVFGLCLMIFSLVISSGFNRCIMIKNNNRLFTYRKFVKIFFITTLQLLNILAFFYMIYRFLKFESEYGELRDCDLQDHEKSSRNLPKIELRSQKTAEIVRKIIEKAAIVRREENFENFLIFGNSVELDGVEYHLNTNKHSPDLTFYFELPRFTSKLVYILPDLRKSQEWSPKFPDNTKLLAKISRNCESGRKLCGLECCPGNVKLITDLLYNSERIVRFKNVTYSRRSELLAAEGSEKICEFQNDRQPKIYFGCLKNQECCSLTCQDLPVALAVSEHREKLLDFWERFKFPLLTCSLFILFLLITVINSKIHNRSRSSSFSPKLRNPGRILLSSDSEKSQLTVSTQMSNNNEQLV